MFTTQAPQTAVESDEVFWEKQKTRLKDAYPELNETEIDRITTLQDRLANIVFDRWLTKRNKRMP